MFALINDVFTAYAVLVLAEIGALAGAQHFLRSLDHVQFSVPLLFVILGVVSVVLTVRLSRRAARDR